MLLLLEGPGWCHVAALQADMGHPEVLLDLRFSLFLTSTDLLLHNLCPGSSCFQPVHPERAQAPGSGRVDPDLEATPLALPGYFTAVIFLPITSTVGIHSLSKIHSLLPPRAAFLLAPVALALLGEPELRLNNICGKLEPGWNLPPWHLHAPATAAVCQMSLSRWRVCLGELLCCSSHTSRALTTHSGHAA